MNLEIKKQHRIELVELISLLKGVQSELATTIVLSPKRASKYWVTDADLYKAALVLENEPTHRMLAKVLETITIIPARAAGEEKNPLTNEELDTLRKVNHHE